MPKNTDRVSFYSAFMGIEHFTADWDDDMYIENGFNTPTEQLVSEGRRAQSQIVITNLSDPEPKPEDFIGAEVKDRR